jgi:hypothetical protein
MELNKIEMLLEKYFEGVKLYTWRKAWNTADVAPHLEQYTQFSGIFQRLLHWSWNKKLRYRR